MLDVFNIAKPQNCDIQIFYGQGTSNSNGQRSWAKPRGVSNIYMLLIGPGSQGTGTTGGGSGAVTVWYGSAKNVPDLLIMSCSLSGTLNSRIAGRFSNSTAAGEDLLIASGGSSSTGGAAMTANQFTASGFFQSVAGQNGSTGNPTPATSTFLSAGGSSGGVNANYGYVTGNSSGYFQLQPIIVGVGGAGTNRGGLGCGGGLNSAAGGQGMVLIASW